MTLDPNGPLCRCGNRGCLERYLADPLIALVHDPVHPRPLRQLVQRRQSMAMPNHPRAAGRSADRRPGLAIIGTIINPPVVVIGGEIILAGDMVMTPLRESFEAHTLVKASEVGEASRTLFLPAQFVENQGCLGAAGLVLRHHGQQVYAAALSRRFRGTRG